MRQFVEKYWDLQRPCVGVVDNKSNCTIYNNISCQTVDTFTHRLHLLSMNFSYESHII